jgi:hypothetical protein
MGFMLSTIEKASQIPIRAGGGGSVSGLGPARCGSQSRATQAVAKPMSGTRHTGDLSAGFLGYPTTPGPDPPRGVSRLREGTENGKTGSRDDPVSLLNP